MKLRLPLVALTSFALSLSSMVTVYAEAPAGDSAKSSGNNFQSVGIRSHGYPVRNWADLAESDAKATPSTGPDVASDSDSADLTWLDSLSAVINGKGAATRAVVGGAAANPITCHTTCISMTGTVALIPVWVGAWATADVTKWNTVLGNIVTSLGTAKANSIAKAGHVFNTNTLYFTSKTKVAPSLQWVTNTAITAPTAVSVTDANVATYINTFISTHSTIVPTGTTPLYVYIGAKTTLLTSGFGTTYCGWHSYGTTSTLKNVQYVAIQDFTSKYYGACAMQTVSPNANVGLDGMASVFTHEIDETLTDPFLNAWYDVYGSENADKCAWTFGTTTTTSGYMYNIQLGSLKYLIQQNWLANNLITTSGLSASTACSLVG